MKKKRHIIKLRYLFRYGLTVMLTAILVFLLANGVLNQYREAVISNAKLNFRETVMKLNENLIKQKEMAERIYFDKLTNPSHMLLKDFYAADGVDQLEVFRNSLALNDYLFVKYREGTLIAQTGSSQTVTFAERTLKLCDNDAAQFRSALESRTFTMQVLESENKGRYLLCLYPMPSEHSQTEDVIGFVIGEETLKQYFEENKKDVPSYMLLAVGEEVIAEVNWLKNASEKEILGLRKELLDGKTTRKGSILMDRYETQSGFTMYTAIDAREVLAEFYQTMTRFFGIGIVIFLTAFGVICLINRQEMGWLKKIKSSLLRLSQNEVIEERDDIVMIQKLITQISIHQQQSEMKNRQFLETLSQWIAELLFDGLIEDEGVLTNMVAQLYPQLQGGYYGVLSVFYRRETPAQTEDLWDGEDFTFICQESYEDYHVVSFLNIYAGKDEQRTERRTLAERLLSLFRDLNIRDTLIVSGRVCEKLSEIHDSYNTLLLLTGLVAERWQTVEQRMFFSEDMIRECFYQEVSELEMEAFSAAIRTGTGEEAKEGLVGIVRKADGIENREQRYFAFVTLIKLLQELLEEKDCSDRQFLQIQRLSCDNAEEFLNTAWKIIEAVKEENRISADDMVDYIRQNFRDNTLGLDTLAKHFHLSSAYVSRCIKEGTGKTYSDYVTELRIREACRLLESTGMSNQDITLEVGYMDHVSFGKKFKRIMGMTMGEYRRQYSFEE